jgi:hypothetical protein
VAVLYDADVVSLNPLRGILSGPPTPVGGAGFNPFAAGKKVYGRGTPAPNIGPVGAAGIPGYQKREQMNKLRRQAIINRGRV